MADPLFHKKTEAKSLKDLVEIAGGELLSDGDKMIEDVAPLHEASDAMISFLDNVKYKDDFKNTKAGACIISAKMKDHAPEGCALILSHSPYKSYALVAQAFYPATINDSHISDNAHIAADAKIGEGCTVEAGAVIMSGVHIGNNSYIGANAVLHENVTIGERTWIGPNASITHAHIGQACKIYAGARIGQDGFGFAIDPAGHVKVPQLGRVIIGDHVEIGANSCIDRGAGPDTIIGDGTWIDNLVQIGHNAKIGKGCVIVAQAGISGSTTLEDYVVIAAQGGVAGHLTIGMGAKVGAQSGVMQNVDPGQDVFGSPSLPIKQALRLHAQLKKMSSKN
ncbi:MAG: UDP-3-O-(3-hydroxymyristoyl)glucosamine N-acyltransferase [Pseudomonadota bacterium]